ncbi:MAG: archaemetzincin family Zn-dependent metalloprotease [Dehalococcoidales bacterium]
MAKSEMIVLIPIGEVEKATLEALRQLLAEVFEQRIQIGDRISLSQESWNESRGQHLATMLLNLVPLRSGGRALGVVDVDIFAPGLNFVFGEADIAGKRALISLHRLRQELYGLPRDEKLFRERTLKEAVHELGHTYGLGHCPDSTCVMHFSNSLSDTDVKNWNFCPNCRRKISRKL